MKRAVVAVCCNLVLCLLATSVHAGGFALYEWSNRGVAMGTTGYAIAGDASVIATNPALMTKLEGSHALAGAVLISPQSTVMVDGQKNKTKANIYTVPHAYYTRQSESNERVWLGVGMFTRFGLGTHYKSNWSGKDTLQYVDLESVSLNPTVAFKFTDQLSVAGGIEILRGGIKQKSEPGASVVSADTIGYAIGGNLGVHYQVDDQWSVGLAWRSSMDMQTEGKGEHPLGGTTSTGQSIWANLPASYVVGIGYQPAENWSWEFDIVHTRWEAFDTMSYSAPINTVKTYDYKNTWRFQLGTEYWATDWLAVRFGYVYDQTPTRSGYSSFMLPCNDRQLYSTGLGFRHDAWTVDWAFMYVKAKERKNLRIANAAVPGTYYNVDFKDGKTWITGLSVGYAF
ncbi:aromatic hydrocarbon degradation protein [Pseudodesulfovibrio sp. F-1]|uniref:Aromatic hydrocarbon degradation protein n=1 Tax=Pseudodesulfovibrio alkaliphilus TaxID=2661613 RepID=A0A7K1KL89_9BACT|nr:outer membrane protein transport protein [Pseudodesulfovibrio alkaliphilus]MUM76825.1 aromatic hydrocarbon degradation protein [Pseudodesulfovibrio alkaliphilus]